MQHLASFHLSQLPTEPLRAFWAQAEPDRRAHSSPLQAQLLSRRCLGVRMLSLAVLYVGPTLGSRCTVSWQG